MDQLFQALVMGLVQGLTEFLPVSSSGHLIVVPALFGWKDPFIDSLAFSVMLHIATLIALLIYFRRDWLVLVPAGFAVLRDRSLRGDPNRRLAWLILVATIPAVIAGVLLNDLVETTFREPRLVAITLVIGAAILWVADRVGRHLRTMEEMSFTTAFGIGVAQAVALVPGISRSGISISAALFANLDRESAARFSFLMATPIIAGAGVWELRKLIAGQSNVHVDAAVLAVGMIAALVSGLAAISFLLRFLRTNPTTIFVVYRILLAIVIVVAWLGLWGR